MERAVERANSLRWRSVGVSRGTSIVLASLLLLSCGRTTEVFPPPTVEDLGLSEQERAAYSPMGFDKFSEALEIAADDKEAVEMVIKRVQHKTIGWSGVVESTRIVKPGDETSEYSLNVSPPREAGAFFPKTYPVLITAPNGDPVSKIEKGTPVVFVGRLEFDGFSREPWVMDARVIEVAAQ